MDSMKDNRKIPQDTALKLCEEVRKGGKGRIFSQCWGCVKYSKGDAARMCFYNGKDNRGCKKINKLFDSQLQGA